MKSCMCFIRGMSAGIIAGMGITLALKCLCSNNKEICRKTGKATKAMSDIMNDIKEMLC